ncbi:M23 family metallopeptidase [Marivibrio halodurans]|uniref:M23 family metallopeptidase n=1 Tax=Marivibrio halodurans TaxID=2039722 RepID=A0A8J7S223_9PROT|nr:M23 family metallopeptidase [Marivibrio halodurans]MBP5858902.1 M23 family metallopeptidase [Marivibrio halodurans]
MAIVRCLRRAAVFSLLLLGLQVPAAAGAVEFLQAEFQQGGYAIGKVDPGARVRFDGHDVRVGADGRFVIGFHRDDPAAMRLEITGPAGDRRVETLSIAQRDYDIQRIDGLPENKVSPPDSVLARIRADAALVAEARVRDSADTWFDSGWIWPVKGPISGVFGSQRILNGEPRQPHYGVDVAVPTGTPVVAPADGVVSLAVPDMYFSGGTLMIDHGRGLASAFLHMDSIAVTPGQRVARGDAIGTVGATGRATGPHLDWRINWFGKRLDAALFVPSMPEGTGN